MSVKSECRGNRARVEGSGGSPPLVISVRVMIQAAMAVAARMVKNQYSRSPRSRNAPGTLEVNLGVPSVLALALADVALPAGVRRTGDSQGKTFCALCPLSTPDRP